MLRLPMNGPNLSGVAYQGFAYDVDRTWGRPVWRFRGVQMHPVTRIVPRGADADPAQVCTIPPWINLEATTLDELRALVAAWVPPGPEA